MGFPFPSLPLPDRSNQFSLLEPQMRHVVGTLLVLAIERLCALEEKFKSMEVHYTFGHQHVLGTRVGEPLKIQGTGF